MNFKPREPKNLEEWLEIATKGIAAAGKERIEREIGEHFAEAVAEHVAGGTTEEIARTNTLVELGDPTVAAKNFRKKHLTTEDERFLRITYNETQRPLGNISLITSMLLLGCMLVYESQSDKPSAGMRTVFWLTLFASNCLTGLSASWVESCRSMWPHVGR